MAEQLTRVGSEVNPTAFAHPTLAFLHEYWNRKRGVRLMPARKDIGVSDLKEHLGWVMLVEVLDDMAEFRYRLIGTLVTEYFLWDGTGRTIAEAFRDQGESTIKAMRAMFRKCARDRIPLRAFGESDWIGPGFEPFQSLYLPLSDDGERVNMILHAFVFDKPSVMQAREFARANGRLPDHPAPPRAT